VKEVLERPPQLHQGGAGKRAVVPESDGSATKAAPDLEKLRAYTSAKLALAGQLRLLKEVHRQRGSASRLRHCEELMAKLAEDRFTLAVVGQFKRGKSSLMNAILGRELMPTGVLPLTSAITVLRFGPKERLLIEREEANPGFPDEVPLGRVADYVTEKGNPGNCRRVRTATLELPCPFLRRGLEFVDTPGVGSAIVANTTTTCSFLPQCDAVLFVTSVDPPLTRLELGFLREIRALVRKIFFVVNKTDLLTDHERPEVLDFIAETLRSQMRSEEVKIFPLSAHAGLSAKLAGDASGYARSGLKELEEKLAAFLSEEKAAFFLGTVADKAVRLLEQEAAEVALGTRARDIPGAVLSEKVEVFKERLRGQSEARQRLCEQLRREVVGKVQSALGPELQLWLEAEARRLCSRSERLVARGAWVFSGGMVRRCSGFVRWQLRRSAWRWVSGQRERLVLVFDEVAREHWERLESDLCGLSKLAADLLGLGQFGGQPREVLSPGVSGFKFEPPFLPEFGWEARVGWALAIVPVGLTRRWVKQRIGGECERLGKSCREQVLLFVAESARRAADAVAEEVENRASEAGGRILAAITGERLAVLGTVYDGKQVLVEGEYGGATLDAIRGRLLAVRAEGLRPTAAGETVDRVGGEAIVAQSPVPARKGSVAAAEQSDVAQDLQTRGCPVCEHLAKAAFGFLSQWQHALVKDEQAQAEFAAELGFCPLHLWQLEAISSPVGASVGQARLVGEVSRLLGQAAQSAASGSFPLQTIRKPDQCRVCRLLREAEATYIGRLADFVREAAGRQAYARSEGPCLRHLGMVLAVSTGEEATRFLLSEAARHFEEMAEDMQSFGIKTESLRRSVRNRDEEDAYLRALIHLVGGKANCYPWSNEGEV
jgi:GTPase Era involved in 16S rRNA processing